MKIIDKAAVAIAVCIIGSIGVMAIVKVFTYIVADLEERRRKNTTIQSSVGTHHSIKCIDGVNYLTSIGTVKIDPDTLLPETCK